MTNIAVVSRDRHGSKAWRPPGGFAFASHEAAVPLVGAEFAKVALEMPIGFVEISGVYAPVALMSPVAGRNFFIGPEGQWLGSYVPSALRAYPFALRRIDGGEEAVLCVDEDSGLLADDDGTAQSFFGADGSPSEAAKGILDFLLQVERNRAATLAAVAALRDAGLFGPWPFSAKIDGHVTPLNGLSRINEAALNALDDAAFLVLRKTGALPLAYLHFLSVAQLSVFERLNVAQQQLMRPRENLVSLDEIFASAESGILRFN
jgi:hypothetical protein